MTSPISCPDLNHLKSMLAGTLPEEEQTVLTEHLDSCATCRQTLEDLATEGESWSGMVRSLKSQPATLESALDQAIKDIKGAPAAPPPAVEEAGLDFLSPPDEPGHLGRLGHYAISGVVGRGGMGVVLKAFDSTLHRVVAVKVLAPQLATSAGARKRFLREARAAAAVTHDHVVTIHAVDEANGMPYLVMQYIAGVSLQDRLDRSGALPLNEIVRIGMQMASGLAAAHAHGLVHRDIKPANILLENGIERVKITDFGLARAVDDASLTQSGTVAGTPQYMAPEQARGEALDHRADLFSLGSVLYAMCTGQAPFRADSALGVLRRVSEDAPPPIQDINPEIPSWLAALIDKLHAKDPAQRYQSATEVAEVLRQHLHQLQGFQAESLYPPKRVPEPTKEFPIRKKKTPRWSRRVAWTLWIAALLALASVLPLKMHDRARSQVETLPKKLQAFPQEKETQLRNLVQTERDKRMHLAITGPANFQAGAPNEYRIETRNLNNQQVPARLTLRIRDEANKDQPVLFESKEIDSTGEYRFVSPISIGLKAKGELLLEVNASGSNTETRLSEKMALLGPAYVTHLTTDRPMYRPGDVVGFRSLTLNSFTRKPADEDLRLIFTVTNSNGQEVYKIEGSALLATRAGAEQLLNGPDGQPIRGVGAGEYPIPADAPGGEYSLTVRDALDRFAPQRRTFLVQHYEKPRLNKELEFTRKSYGPGDKVVAGGRVSRIEGGLPVADQPVSATILVDGKRYRADGKEDANAEIALRTDGNGTVAVRFLLPAQIDKGAASLSLRFTDGGNVETVVRPIPVVVKKLQVEFFPEGGDLVAGVPNRVYFQARTMLDRPADLKARIVDDKGKGVAEVQTFNDDKQAGANQGMGSFEFTPVAGTAYELKIDAPAGIEGKYPLPRVMSAGVVLHVPEGAAMERGRTDSQSVLRVMVRSAERDRQRVVVGVFYHGRLLAHESKACKALEATPFDLRPNGPGGVYRVTVFEEDDHGNMLPLAERLVYRQPAQRLQLAVTPDKQVYIPRERVKITCSAADEMGKAKPAILLVGVVDKGVLALADEKTVRAMPTHFLLATEVRHAEDLEHADFLVSDDPQAARALDLLLGTQGWRRFAEKDPGQLRQKEPEASTRLLAGLGQMPLKTSNTLAVEEAFVPELNEKLRVKSAQLNKEQLQLQEDLAQAQRNLEFFRRAGKVLGVLALGLVGLGIVAGLIVVTLVLLKRAGPVAAAVVGVLGMVCLLFAVGLLVTQTAKWEMAASRDAKTKGAAMKEGAMTAPRDKAHAGLRGPFQLAEDEFDFPSEDNGPAYRDNRHELAIKVNNERAELFQNKRFPLPDGREFRRSHPEQVPLPALVAREYVHRAVNLSSNVRSDFTETVYWNPALVLSDGKVFLDFDLSDSITSYQIRVLGHTLDGRLAEMTSTIMARKPFSLEPKIPIEISHNDKVDLPVTVANDTNESREVDVRVRVKNLSLAEGQAQQRMQLDANQRKRLVYRLQPTVVEGTAYLGVAGKCTPFAEDRVVCRIKVMPDGFPITGSHSDVLDQIVRHDLVLPKTWIKGTLKVELKAYPSILADLQTGLDAMLQEPHGCFEQASSSNYPNLLILDYLQGSRQANPALTRRAQDLLARGYPKLVAFECSNPTKNLREGYEWFGGAAPPHEALTAYGLLEFRDMSRVYEVDKAMVERTRAYLLGQRDGQGGFKRNSRSLDQFGRAPDNITNAYIVWALTEGGKDDDVSRELSALTRQAKTERDPYFLALVANSLLNRGQKEEAAPLLKALADAQDKDGFVAGAHTSIVASRGRDLQIETTALAVLAWTRANPPKQIAQFRDNLQAAGKWLTRQRSSTGGFGATQANVLALKAITTLSQVGKAKAGELILHVADRDVAHGKIAAGTLEVLNLDLPDPEEVLHPGVNKLRIESVGGNDFPYTLTWSYNTLTPPSSAACPVTLTTRLDRSRAQEGDTLRLSATIENKEDKGQGMAVAIIGLPGGLTLPEDMKQLKELARAQNEGGEPSISFWEVRGRELILYWRQLAPKQKVAVNLDLICRVPGEYRGPASRAYLYYGADEKCWVEPLGVVITPRD